MFTQNATAHLPPAAASVLSAAMQQNSSMVTVPAMDILQLLRSAGAKPNHDSRGMISSIDNSFSHTNNSDISSDVAESKLFCATFPCRARGMPPSHNSLYAQLTVTSETKHGDGLVCSHPTCQNGGIKFMYCRPCKRAVSKRLFRGKHKDCEKSEQSMDKKWKATPTPGSDAIRSLTPAKRAATMATFAEPPRDSKKRPPPSNGTGDKMISDNGGNTMSSTGDTLSDVGNSSQESCLPGDGSDTTNSSNIDSSSNCKEEKTEIEEDGLAILYLNQSATMNSGVDQWTNLLLLRPSTSNSKHTAAWLQATVLASKEGGTHTQKD